ncbi:MAG TPA: ATP-binding protein [Opitutaceae bacterium]|nr:ATP-binding protein [Opitutaceae bacterium]
MVTDTTFPPVATTGSETEGADSPRGGASRRFSISGEVIAKAVADMPDDAREAVKWLAAYCVSKNLSYREVADKLKKSNGQPYSGDSLYSLFVGRRDSEQLGPMVDSITAFRRQIEENLIRADTNFIETTISRKIFGVCDKARARQRIVIIYGESQIGKSTNLIVYKERSPIGDTVYVRMPTGGSLHALEQEMALVLNVPTSLNGTDRRRGILNCFDSRMLLIVDEAHEGSRKALNFVREIHDRRTCGVVLAGTNVLKQALVNGPFAKNFRQILLRGLPPLQLPEKPSTAELATFAAAFDLGPAPKDEQAVRVTYTDDSGRERTKVVQSIPFALQQQVIERDGLGRWVTILQEARDMAKEKRRPISWGSVIAAWHAFECLSRMDGEGGES